MPRGAVDPNDISGEVRRIRRAFDEFGIKAVTSFPAGCNPQVPVSDRRYYPIFQTCIDLDIPVILNAGIAGPRVPSSTTMPAVSSNCEVTSCPMLAPG